MTKYARFEKTKGYAALLLDLMNQQDDQRQIYHLTQVRQEYPKVKGVVVSRLPLMLERLCIAIVVLPGIGVGLQKIWRRRHLGIATKIVEIAIDGYQEP